MRYIEHVADRLSTCCGHSTVYGAMPIGWMQLVSILFHGDDVLCENTSQRPTRQADICKGLDPADKVTEWRVSTRYLINEEHMSIYQAGPQGISRAHPSSEVMGIVWDGDASSCMKSAGTIGSRCNMNRCGTRGSESA